MGKDFVMDVWDWILKTPEQRATPMVSNPLVSYPTPLGVIYGKMAPKTMTQDQPKLPADRNVNPPALQASQAVAPGKTPKQAVNPATISIDKFGQVNAAAPASPGNPIPDKSKGQYPASAMGTFNPSNMGPIGDLRPPPGIMPEGGPFAGAPAGVLMTSEQFRQYFYKQYGRWPFAEEITSQKLIYPREYGAAQEAAADGGGYEDTGGSGGYGGGGGGGGGTAPEQPLPEQLGELAWWANADSIQPLLRGWAGWLKESVESNRGIKALANPFTIDAAAETAAGPADSKVPRMAGFKTNSEMLTKLQERLGLTFDDSDTQTTKWQKFINKIPTIPNTDMETQQMLAGLRYDANSDRWYGVDIGQLINPQYT